jgi:hypothetical protein
MQELLHRTLERRSGDETVTSERILKGCQNLTGGIVRRRAHDDCSPGWCFAWNSCRRTVSAMTSCSRRSNATDA